MLEVKPILYDIENISTEYGIYDASEQLNEKLFENCYYINEISKNSSKNLFRRLYEQIWEITK